ncbi:MAG: hypothetical protein DCC67_10840 [Planctomycetota bacterium]|nr:MAG: hypothetical protein DCC67_10840 [Planctomycetota bacterium]
MRRLRLSAVETSYRIRAYVPTGAPTLRVEGGAGYNDHVLAAGWQTIESRLPKSKMADDARGPFLRLKQLDATALYVAWVKVDQNPPVYAGVYTPILTDIENIANFDAYECQYLRVGNTVTVSGQADIEPDDPNTATRVRISLPVVSNLSSGADCSGTAAGTAYAAIQGIISGQIYGDAANNEATLLFYTPSTAVDLNLRFHFTYQIIAP